MINKCFKLVVLALFLFNIVLVNVFAEGAKEEELAVLKTQVQGLLNRIEKLEAGQVNDKEEVKKTKEELSKVKEAQQAIQAGRVDLANALSKLKIKGRAALGFLIPERPALTPRVLLKCRMPSCSLLFSRMILIHLLLVLM